MKTRNLESLMVYQPRPLRGALILAVGLLLVTLSWWFPESWRDRLPFEAISNWCFFASFPFLLVGAGQAGFSARLFLDPENQRLLHVRRFFGLEKTVPIPFSALQAVQIRGFSRMDEEDALYNPTAFEIRLDHGGETMLPAGIHTDYTVARRTAEHLSTMTGAPLQDTLATPIYDETVQPTAGHDPVLQRAPRAEPQTAPAGSLPEDGPPAGSGIRVQRDGEAVCVELPSRTPSRQVYTGIIAACAVVGVVSVVGMVYAVDATTARWVHTFWGLPIAAGAGVLAGTYGAVVWAGRYERITVSPQGLRHEWVQPVEGATENLALGDLDGFGFTKRMALRVRLERESPRRSRAASLVARAGARRLEMGTALTPAEAHWVYGVIRAALARHRDIPNPPGQPAPSPRPD